MSDLTKEEQANVRAALRFIKVRVGSWERLATVTRYQPKTLVSVSEGSASNPPTVTLAFRLARLAQVPTDDVISGVYPRGGGLPPLRSHPGRRACPVSHTGRPESHGRRATFRAKPVASCGFGLLDARLAWLRKRCRHTDPSCLERVFATYPDARAQLFRIDTYGQEAWLRQHRPLRRYRLR